MNTDNAQKVTKAEAIKMRRLVKRLDKSAKACRKAFYELPQQLQRRMVLQLGVECGALVQGPEATVSEMETVPREGDAVESAAG